MGPILRTKTKILFLLVRVDEKAKEVACKGEDEGDDGVKKVEGCGRLGNTEK